MRCANSNSPNLRCHKLPQPNCQRTTPTSGTVSSTGDAFLTRQSGASRNPSPVKLHCVLAGHTRQVTEYTDPAVACQRPKRLRTEKNLKRLINAPKNRLLRPIILPEIAALSLKQRRFRSPRPLSAPAKPLYRLPGHRQAIKNNAHVPADVSAPSHPVLRVGVPAIQTSAKLSPGGNCLTQTFELLEPASGP